MNHAAIADALHGLYLQLTVVRLEIPCDTDAERRAALAAGAAQSLLMEAEGFLRVAAAERVEDPCNAK